VQISTSSLANNAAFVLDGEDDSTEQFKSSRKLAYLPSVATTYNLWYKQRWMTITRIQNQTGWYGGKEQSLSIRIMTRSHKVLSSLLQEARRDYLAAQQHKMCVYVSDTCADLSFFPLLRLTRHVGPITGGMLRVGRSAP
jgi:chaperone BCS1